MNLVTLNKLVNSVYMPESSQFSNVYILVSQTCRFMNNFKCSVTGFLNTLSIIGHDYVNIEKKASRY